MKLKNVIMLVAAGSMMFMNACNSIEDRDVLENTFDPNNIKLEVVQTAGGKGNGLTLKMTTPGVIGYWDYLIDKKYSNEVNVTFPIPGTHTFKYIVSTPYLPNGDLSKRENVVKTIDVTVETLDQELPAAYYLLLGNELQGKTWVFDGAGGDGRQWYFMSDPTNPWGQWWNAGGECCPPGDVGGKMVFDLDGGANYTYYTTSGGTGTKGSFSFSGDFKKFYVKDGVNILGAGSNGAGNANGEYTIVELKEDRLVLFTGTNGAGTGWTWVFKPAAM